jgi:hypothetical protein
MDMCIDTSTYLCIYTKPIPFVVSPLWKLELLAYSFGR